MDVNIFSAFKDKVLVEWSEMLNMFPKSNASRKPDIKQLLSDHFEKKYFLDFSIKQYGWVNKLILRSEKYELSQVCGPIHHNLFRMFSCVNEMYN